jgi:hypothetical protein
VAHAQIILGHGAQRFAMTIGAILQGGVNRTVEIAKRWLLFPRGGATLQFNSSMDTARVEPYARFAV